MIHKLTITIGLKKIVIVFEKITKMPRLRFDPRTIQLENKTLPTTLPIALATVAAELEILPYFVTVSY